MAHWMEPTDRFVDRHIGPREDEIDEMLTAIGVESLDDMIARTVPAAIRMDGRLDLGAGVSERELLATLKRIAGRNRRYRSYIGMGYVDCVTPPVILRNILENPGWYTQYTPYQAEISQGRLEALLNFQTMICDLCGMEIANASLLDEATAAAEGMGMLHAAQKKARCDAFFVSSGCHPQTIDVVTTRAKARGWKVIVGDHRTCDFSEPVFGVLVQYPASDGEICDYRDFTEKAHAAGAKVIFAADLLALCLLVPPGEIGADVVVGSTQRFGMPMGLGGPHAAFFATGEEYKRLLPGRIIGISRDATGKPALRMALQTREQHIRREKATSNICTAQVLPAVVASMYAVYHGPHGLRRIAERVHRITRLFATSIERCGIQLAHDRYFDTLRLEIGDEEQEKMLERARQEEVNLRVFAEGGLGITLDEAVTGSELDALLRVLGGSETVEESEGDGEMCAWGRELSRETSYLTHPVFNSHHSETEMLRYMGQLQVRDLSLVTSMIPLGSCTMKLNATAEMIPITWEEFAGIHPFAPEEQIEGYRYIMDDLSAMLAGITGMAAVSLQPNAGSQGEYAGLLVVRKYHEMRGEGQRNICLIPASAHGTNPASAVMAGYRVLVVQCDEEGNIDLEDLRKKATENAEMLAALMVTYPSTHGVFEEGIREICRIVHDNGGQVYMDGANMNALVGLCRPGDIGMDVCHLNLHKTFCIPHGGGGPGMGPIAVAPHLIAYLPTHAVVQTGGEAGIGAVAAGPWGSPLILPISWAYLKMMGGEGATRATQVAILNANYLAHRLDSHYPILYRGKSGFVAHEAILDLRPLKNSSGVTVEDVAKRLMDYGYHAPTISFPVPGTVMIEPTESESKAELDRFCEAMIAIRAEIEEIENRAADKENNLLKNAPHTAGMVCAEEWSMPYSRRRAAFPASWIEGRKFWPAVGRVDNAQGDRNLVCSCLPVEAYGEAESEDRE